MYNTPLYNRCLVNHRNGCVKIKCFNDISFYTKKPILSGNGLSACSITYITYITFTVSIHFLFYILKLNFFSDIKCRIAQAKQAFYKKKHIFTANTVSFKTRKTLIKSFVWSIALYGAKTWTIYKAERRKIEACRITSERDRSLMNISLVENINGNNTLLSGNILLYRHTGTFLMTSMSTEKTNPFHQYFSDECVVGRVIVRPITSLRLTVKIVLEKYNLIKCIDFFCR
ncbi:hypothetical protein AGLY_004488 [Aphis glycines]|uniref:Uncharacterized protein n=1 Tax=Aphis glycines TaxID=307491 RepID=A0A6G0U0J6_APHGL|nr:hypothetical protein AGLY_004488 [Aphis glycines]